MKFEKIMIVFALTCLASAALAGTPAGVYQQYTPVPTKTPVSGSVPGQAHITIFKDTVALGLKVGMAMPLGDDAKNQNAGLVAGFDFNYGASPELGFAFFGEYSSMPYKLTMAAQPLTSLGVGIKATYQLFAADGLKPFVEGGMGYFMVTRASASPTGVIDPGGVAVTETKYSQGGGIGFTGGAGALYEFTPNFSLRVTLSVTNVSLNGGTGDSILYAAPNVGFLYTF